MCGAAPSCAQWTETPLKLLLALLAIITGLSGGDSARATQIAPAAVGAAIALAEAAGEVHAARLSHRPQQAMPERFVPDAAVLPRAVTAAPVQTDVPTYGLRTRE
jgi:hypothetical protein